MKKLILLLLLTGCCRPETFAQGCSDAGFCSAGALQSGHQDTVMKRKKRSAGLSCAFGIGEKETFIVIPQLEVQWQVGKKAMLEVKLPWYYANGKLGYVNRPGDILATISAPLWKKDKWRLNGTGGLRISTGNGDASFNGIALPMPYQSNLGTTDLILGASVDYTSYLTIAAGWQQPILQYNRNQYFPAMMDDQAYFASRELKRKGDILLRTEGHYSWKKITLSAGPLFIYHLGRDVARNFAGEDITLNGSEGLTLNLAGSISYTKGRSRLELAGGTPFVVRSYRPDGLTREWVIAPKYVFSF
jgi:hypothetical protein